MKKSILFKDHYKKPINVGVLPNYSASSSLETSSGQKINFYLLFDQNEKVKSSSYTYTLLDLDVAFLSMMTVFIEAMSVEQLSDLSAQRLWELAKQDLSFSEDFSLEDQPLYLLSIQALTQAVDNYLGRKIFSWEELTGKSSDRLVCRCLGVTTDDFVTQNLKIDQFKQELSISTKCGNCQPEMEQWIEKFENQSSDLDQYHHKLLCRCFKLNYLKVFSYAKYLSSKKSTIAGSCCGKCRPQVEHFLHFDKEKFEEKEVYQYEQLLKIDLLIQLDQLVKNQFSKVSKSVEIIDLNCFHLKLRALNKIKDEEFSALFLTLKNEIGYHFTFEQV